MATMATNDTMAGNATDTADPYSLPNCPTGYMMQYEYHRIPVIAVPCILLPEFLRTLPGEIRMYDRMVRRGGRAHFAEILFLCIKYCAVFGLLCFMIEEWTTWLTSRGCLALDWLMKLSMYACGSLVSLALAIRCYIIFHRPRRLGLALLCAVGVQAALALAVVATELKFDRVEDGYCMKSGGSYDNGGETLAYLAWTLALDGGVLLACCWRLLGGGSGGHRRLRGHGNGNGNNTGTAHGPAPARLKMHATTALLFRHSVHYLVSVCLLNAVQFVLSFVSDLPKLMVLVLSVQVCVALQQLIAEQDAVNGYPGHVRSQGSSYSGGGKAGGYAGKSSPRAAGGGGGGGGAGLARLESSKAPTTKYGDGDGDGAEESAEHVISKPTLPEAAYRRASDGNESFTSGTKAAGAGLPPREAYRDAHQDLRIDVRVGTPSHDHHEGYDDTAARPAVPVAAPAGRQRPRAQTESLRTAWSWADVFQAEASQGQQQQQQQGALQRQASLQARHHLNLADDVQERIPNVPPPNASLSSPGQRDPHSKRIDFLYAPALRVPPEHARLWPPINPNSREQPEWCSRGGGGGGDGLGDPDVGCEPQRDDTDADADAATHQSITLQELYEAAPASSGGDRDGDGDGAGSMRSGSSRDGGSGAASLRSTTGVVGGRESPRAGAPRRKVPPLWLLEGQELDLGGGITGEGEHAEVRVPRADHSAPAYGTGTAARPAGHESTMGPPTRCE